MKNRLPIAVSVTALVVALLGVTGVAEAVQNAVSFANNAGKLRGFAPSKTSKKNTVVVRGANGKIDARSIPAQARGAPGPPGPAGPAGPQGPQGPAGAPNPNAVDSDKVDNYHANELVRAEQSTFSGSLVLTVAGETLNAPVIIAPHAGYLLVNATGTFDLVHGGWQVRCGVDVDTLGGSAWAANHHSSNVAENTTSSGSPGPFPCGITRRFPVAAGVHTVRFKARAEFNTGATALGSQITVLYVPFGPTG